MIVFINRAHQDKKCLMTLKMSVNKNKKSSLIQRYKHQFRVQRKKIINMVVLKSCKFDE